MSCPICNSQSHFLCDKKDRFGGSYKYVICENCRFIFEHDLVSDIPGLQKRMGGLYKSDYFDKIDVGWQMRGDGFLRIIKKIVKTYSILKPKKGVSVLDYGGGNGYIASRLAENFNVLYYDKYEKPSIAGKYKILEKPAKADIIYAVELVEHIADIKEWDFFKDLNPDIFIFTTGLSDNITEKEISSWSYLNPDGGHMALYSYKSLYLLGKKYGFIYFFFPNISCHIFLRSKFFSSLYFVKIEYFIYSIFRKVKNLFR